MKIAAQLLFVVVLLVGCESEPVKRIYTEKDIEGYWATDNFLNPSQLKDSMSLEKFNPKEDLLRFFNVCNGFEDTVYRIAGDTVYMMSVDMNIERDFIRTYTPVYSISFASTDRIILKNFTTGVLKTYYSLMNLPQRGQPLISSELLGCYGVFWNGDSVKSSTREDFCHGCGFGSDPQFGFRSDSASFDRLKNLYSRIDREQLLFGDRGHVHSPNSTPLPPLNGAVEMIGSNSKDVIWLSDCTDPCVWAIHEELISMERVFYFNSSSTSRK